MVLEMKVCVCFLCILSVIMCECKYVCVCLKCYAYVVCNEAVFIVLNVYLFVSVL